MTVTTHRTNDPAVRTTEVNGATYYVTKMGPNTYGVARDGKVVTVTESAKAAKAAVAQDAGVTEVAAPVGNTAEVRRWATATGRTTATRGRVSAELVAEFEARPAGAWRTRTGKFVKGAKA